MGLRSVIIKLLNIHEEEIPKVSLLLVFGFFIGFYLATLSVGASTLFLNSYPDEELENILPLAIVSSGCLGIIFTAIYNFFQARLGFSRLALSSLFVLSIVLLAVELAFRTTDNTQSIYFFAYTFIIPSSYILLLVFWGAFGRMFSIRQSKRIIGSIDTGQLVASIIAFFSIVMLVPKTLSSKDLLTISLISMVGNFLVFLIISKRHLMVSGARAIQQRVKYRGLLKSKYISLMAAFVVISMIAVRFIDYSFLNVTTRQFDENALPKFLSLFEGTVVIFSFLFQTFVTDRIITMYGLKVALLVNPILLAIFTAIALPIGYAFGTEAGPSMIFFFIIISMSKLFGASLKDALDSPAFKLYFLPMDANIKFDVQTKIEGVVTALAGLIAGALIILIKRLQLFDLIHISIFTLPVLALWYFTTTRMYQNYRDTLKNTLSRNKKKSGSIARQEFATSKILENEIESKIDDKVLYGLKLMESLEPALFESSLLKLKGTGSKKVRLYIDEKLKTLELGPMDQSEIHTLAREAADMADDGELISVSYKKLAILAKSIDSKDRILAAKLLRKLTNDDNIFILLELMRDVDPKVKNEALITARKIKRRETWNILIDLLDSPTYSNAAAAALAQAGHAVLFTLETAFHKSGQNDATMLKIVQIMGRIGGVKAINLLWNKIEYPDRRIVKQILLSFRHVNYQAGTKQRGNLLSILETEIGKSIWNLAALTELPKTSYYTFLRAAIKEEINENFDTIYILLSILYDPQSVQLVRENIESETSEGIAFAMELLDIFLDPDLKPKLLPLVDDISIEEKLKLLQTHFPRESYNEIQVLNYLLNKNYNHINRWTKACALHATAFIDNFRISRGLVAQLFNSDKLLQEVAAWVIYHKDKQAYASVAQRLDKETQRSLGFSVQKNRLHQGLQDGYFLKIEIVLFIKSIPVFKDIKGLLLCDLADRVNLKHLEDGENTIIKNNHDEFIYIVADGKITLKENGVGPTLKKGEVYGKIFSLDDSPQIFDEMQAIGRSVVFEITLFDFYSVMANHHELAQGLIKNISKKFKLGISQ